MSKNQVSMKNEGMVEVECPVCYEFFTPTTSGSHSPLLLQNCGHTVCKGCCSAIKANDSSQNFKCPFCKIQSPFFPNYSLIQLLNKGYLTCYRCLYPLKTNLKECLFNKKGDFCYHCSEQVKDATLSNFSLIDAMEQYKKIEHICQQGNGNDCKQKYDLKIFQTVCQCEDIRQSQNMFSAFFLTSNLFNQEQFEAVTKQVFDDTNKLYEKQKQEQSFHERYEQLMNLKKFFDGAIQNLQKSWNNVVDNFFKDIDFSQQKQSQTYSSNIADDLFYKVKQQTEDFTKINIDTLFNAAETNKIMESQNSDVIKHLTKDQKDKVKTTKNLMTQIANLKIQAKEMVSYINTFTEKFNKGGLDAVNNDTNFQYKNNPFVDLKPNSVNT